MVQGKAIEKSLMVDRTNNFEPEAQQAAPLLFSFS